MRERNRRVREKKDSEKVLPSREIERDKERGKEKKKGERN